MNTLRVSVVCIFYQAERFFREAIDSVLRQDMRDFELLLVDDGSTDASRRMADEYAEEDPTRIRVLEHPGRCNRGMSATRNLGLREARGEFVAFIDADDRWAPNKLREQLEVFARNPEVDGVCGSVRYWKSWNGGRDRIVPTGHIQNRPLHPPETSLALYPLGTAAAPCPSDLMVRRSAALALGGFEESFTGALQMYEDQAFLAKLYLERTVYFSDAQWLDYRIHEDSCVSSVRRDGRYGEVRRQFLEWFAAYLDQRPEANARAVRGAVDRSIDGLYPSRISSVLRRGMRAIRKVRVA